MILGKRNVGAQLRVDCGIAAVYLACKPEKLFFVAEEVYAVLQRRLFDPGHRPYARVLKRGRRPGRRFFDTAGLVAGDHDLEDLSGVRWLYYILRRVCAFDQSGSAVPLIGRLIGFD